MIIQFEFIFFLFHIRPGRIENVEGMIITHPGNFSRNNVVSRES